MTIEKEHHKSEEVLVIKLPNFRTITRKEKYCSVLTFDGKTKNPEYNPRRRDSLSY